MTWGGRAAQLQPLLQEALRLIARAVEADVHGHGGALHHWSCHRLQQLTTDPQTPGFSAGSIHFGAQIDIQYARECLLKCLLKLSAAHGFPIDCFSLEEIVGQI